MLKVAVLDDWQHIAQQSADWSLLQPHADVAFLHEAFADEDDAASKLAPFEALLLMRERTAMPASLIGRLPNLRMIGSTGNRTPSLDVAACTARGVLVCNTGGEKSGAATAELALGLMMAAMRDLQAGGVAVRAGGFQEGVAVGRLLEGRTLGVIGLGRIGARMAGYGRALGMEVLAWSPNLTAERAAAAGARLAGKDELLERADVVSLHLVLSERSRGILGEADLARMKHRAVLVNTSRGPLVDEAALLAAVQSRRIIAALDVYDREPLPKGHPWLTAPNAVLSPHLGYGVAEVFEQFHRESVENVLAWIAGKPVRVVNPEALRRSKEA